MAQTSAPRRSPAVDHAALRAAVAARVAALRAVAPGAVVAVSVRDLAPGGGTMAAAPDSVFHAASTRRARGEHAASTMKLPVMIGVVRQAERGALPLDQPVLLVNRFASVADGSPYALDPADDSDSAAHALAGRRVPVAELVRRVTVRSSHLATNALVALTGPAALTATARALGAPHTLVRRGVEDAAAFRRGIVNGTTAPDLAALLTAGEQGRAASAAGCGWMRRVRRVLLAQAVSAEIPAGVPAGTPVAHKTGWIRGVLHDAAVVYPPGRAPSVLVVLTRGVPDEAAARAARAARVDVSRAAWTALGAPSGG